MYKRLTILGKNNLTENQILQSIMAYSEELLEQE